MSQAYHHPLPQSSALPSRLIRRREIYSMDLVFRKGNVDSRAGSWPALPPVALHGSEDEDRGREVLHNGIVIGARRADAFKEGPAGGFVLRPPGAVRPR
jgi:hypothetical protein